MKLNKLIYIDGPNIIFFAIRVQAVESFPLGQFVDIRRLDLFTEQAGVGNKVKSSIELLFNFIRIRSFLDLRLGELAVVRRVVLSSPVKSWVPRAKGPLLAGVLRGLISIVSPPLRSLELATLFLLFYILSFFLIVSFKRKAYWCSFSAWNIGIVWNSISI